MTRCALKERRGNKFAMDVQQHVGTLEELTAACECYRGNACDDTPHENRTYGLR